MNNPIVFFNSGAKIRWFWAYFQTFFSFFSAVVWTTKKRMDRTGKASQFLSISSFFLC